MEYELGRCIGWIDEGENSLVGFEERLYIGDLDGAADVLRSAWQSLLEPLVVLSNCWSGGFWADWEHRAFLERNINKAQDLLLGATAEDVENVLIEIKNLMLSNFYLIRKALTQIGADIGPLAGIIADNEKTYQ